MIGKTEERACTMTLMPVLEKPKRGQWSRREKGKEKRVTKLGSELGHAEFCRSFSIFCSLSEDQWKANEVIYAKDVADLRCESTSELRQAEVRERFPFLCNGLQE